MKLLVVSDIHGNRKLFEQIIISNPDVEGLFFLGDGMNDFKAVASKYPHLKVFCTAGNCDTFNEQEPQVVDIEGFKVFYTHGHRYSVKTGFSEICGVAHKLDADIVLFGHTHIPCNEIISNLYLFNPGALSRALEEFSYGLIALKYGKKPIFKHIILPFEESMPTSEDVIFSYL